MLFGGADFSAYRVFFSDKFKEHYKCYLKPRSKGGHISIFTDGCITGTRRLRHTGKATLGGTTCTTPFPASNYDFHPGNHTALPLWNGNQDTPNEKSSFYLGVRHVLEGLGAVGDMLLCVRLSGVVDVKLWNHPSLSSFPKFYNFVTKEKILYN